jgi:hypothetical protein
MKFLDFFKRRNAAMSATIKKEEVVNVGTNISQNSTKRPNFTPENINSLLPDEIFVFGSNLAGHHGGGAARTALNKFGAIYGQGVGLQGQCYAIPTMQGGVETIVQYVDDFIDFAKKHTENFFYVTRIGCGIAGFRDEEIAPLFEKALNLSNVCLPKTFVNKITEKVEKNKPIVIEFSKYILDTFSVYDIIYAEIAEGGAMGCSGRIIFYVIKGEQLVCYETNISKDDSIYVEKLLLNHQDYIKSDNIQVSEVLFNYYYGGFGNHVFVNKNVSLETLDEHFVYKRNNIEYHIYSSVFGVFNSVTNAMQNPKNKGK